MAIFTVGALATVLWSGLLILLYSRSVESEMISFRSHALLEARTAYSKDISYRRWASNMGGVYVQIRDGVQPNPYLDVPYRDAVTTNGLHLTLINPAYMTRMVYNVMRLSPGLQAHITSLNPIRPSNKPSAWEAKALASFHSAHDEFYEFTTENNESALHFMRPMVTEKSCLKCHGKQGYKEGDIRGGISVTVPMAPYEAAVDKQKSNARIQYGFIWGGGMSFLLLAFAVLIRSEVLQRRGETRLRESEEKYRLLFSSIMDPVVVLDRTTEQVVECNETAESYFGMSRNDLLGLRPHDFIVCNATSVTGNSSSLPIDFRAVGSAVQHFPNVTVKTAGKTLGHASILTKPFCIQQQDLVLVLFHDITDQLKAEASLRKSKQLADEANTAKSQFLANMSHEIRTPLNGVIGMLQLMRTTDLNSEQNEYIHHALASSTRLTRLLSDILDLSRIEADNLVLNEDPFFLTEVINALGALFSKTACDKGIELRLHIDPSIPQQLVGDELRLQQILFNLVGNAIKFTDSGYVELTISPLSSRDDRNVCLLFCVADTGSGIADNQLDAVFSAFVQGEKSLTRSHQGAGLGLSIVRRLVTAMNTELAVDSMPGHGTRMYFSLQFKQMSDDRATENTEYVVSNSITAPFPDLQEKQCILVVEDDETCLHAAASILEKMGFSLLAAHNGQEALDMLTTTPVDCILMDIEMPLLDGVSATRNIRAMSDAFANIPIIAMTAHALPGDRERFIATGMTDYISKPIDMNKLLKIITFHLGTGCKSETRRDNHG
ncbi:response regulator [Desulfovibrio inopinatus]|uniref:response regulator n=1 Tax=Desulfovibrio inopinatus TaxID=102109 RepID=UPI0004109408|nr:response regulator [Desulfovibrio inopinatus]